MTRYANAKQALTIGLAAALSLTLGLSLASAAQPQAPTRGQAGDVLTPLAVGNTWVYEGEADDPVLTTDRIEGVVLFDGEPWHLLRSYERQRDQPDARNLPNGSELWLAMFDGQEHDALVQTDEETAALSLTKISGYYRYPATLGQTYTPEAEDQTIVMTVTSLSEKIKTKAGEFDCVVYTETSTEDPDYSFTSYVAPGVGIVQLIINETGETYTSSLVSYTFVEDE